MSGWILPRPLGPGGSDSGESRPGATPSREAGPPLATDSLSGTCATVTGSLIPEGACAVALPVAAASLSSSSVLVAA
jgi:hypothetical protein